MSIQSNINQMLSIGAMLASRNPALKAKAEARAQEAQLLKESAGLEKQMEIEKKHHQGRSQIGIKTKKEYAKVKRKQFVINPNEKTYQAYKIAENALVSAQSEKKNGRADYLSAPTNLGINVGDLGASAIEQILAQVSKKELRTLAEGGKK